MCASFLAAAAPNIGQAYVIDGHPIEIRGQHICLSAGYRVGRPTDDLLGAAEGKLDVASYLPHWVCLDGSRVGCQRPQFPAAPDTTGNPDSQRGLSAALLTRAKAGATGQ